MVNAHLPDCSTNTTLLKRNPIPKFLQKPTLKNKILTHPMIPNTANHPQSLQKQSLLGVSISDAPLELSDSSHQPTHYYKVQQ